MTGLPMWVIFHNPTDYPGKFVLRRNVITPNVVTPDPEPLAVTDTLKEARDALPPNLYRIERMKFDLPSVVEVWL